MSEVEKTTSFLELLQKQGDKATLNEIIDTKKLLPTHVVANIPACLYDTEGALDEEVLIVMSYVRARRDNPDITILEVGDRIGNHTPELLLGIIKQLVYFYTTSSWDEIEERYQEQVESEEEEAGEPQENPTE